MRGDDKIIELLNEVLTAELTAINQYFIHYKMCQNWGYKRLAHKKYEESIEEMKHADRVIERILFLDGTPNMQRLSPVKVGENAVEQHELDLALELNAVTRLNQAIELAHTKQDNGTRELLEQILRDEEESVDWHEAQLAFTLKQILTTDAPRGTYHLISRHRPGAVSASSLPTSHYLFRLTHPLGEYVIDEGKGLDTPAASLTFDLDAHPTKISQLEPLRGKSGYLRLHQLTVDSYETERFLLVSAHLDEKGRPGSSLDPETAERLLACTCTASEPATIPSVHAERLDAESRRHREGTLSQSIERNNRHFLRATEQIDRWADDKIRAAEAELVQVKGEIRSLRNQARQAETLEEQHRLQEEIRRAEKRKRRARREIDDIEDDIENQRDQLISSLESRLSRGQTHLDLFTVRFLLS